MAILAPLLPVAHYARMRERTSPSRALVGVLCPPMFAAVGVAIGVFALLNPTLVFHPHEFYRVLVGETTCVSTAAGKWLEDLPDLLMKPADLLTYGFSTLGVISMGLGACLALVSRRRRDQLLLWGAGIVWVVMAVIGTIYPRHLFPALPMLALLSGRAVFQACGPLRGRPSWWGLVSALCLFLIGPPLYRSIGYVRLFATTNVRTEAGEWIAKPENVPLGASLGTPQEPWQFDFPPVDAKLYQMEVTGFDAEVLRTRAPSFYVLSDRLRNPIFVPPDRKVEEFWYELTSGGRYEFYKQFEKTPGVWARLDRPPHRLLEPLWSLIGLQTDNREAPEDMRYVNPIITIYRRSGTFISAR